MQIRVLHIIDSLGRGGAETLLVNSLKYLPFEHHLAYLDDVCSFDKESINAKMICLDFNTRLRRFPGMIRRIRRYIRQNNITHVHAHLFWSILLARLASPRSVKVFCTLHNIQSRSSLKRKWARWVEQITFRKKDKLIAVSNTVLDDYRRIVKKARGIVLYNFIDPVYFKQPGDRTPKAAKTRFVAIGTLKEQKNYPYLLNLFGELKDKGLEASLEIFGNGPKKEELQSVIEKNKLPVVLRGNHPRIHEVLGEYDAFIMTSVNEGCPLSVWEAMASGLPAFLSDIPVFHEVSNEHAVFLNIQDPADGSRQLIEWLKKPLELEKLNSEGKQWVASVAKPSHYVEKLTAIYNSN